MYFKRAAQQEENQGVQPGVQSYHPFKTFHKL